MPKVFFRSHPARLALALLAAATLLLAGAAQAGERIALLIGNARFANPALDLRNPAHDARALAEALEPLGFATETVIDADRAEAEAALADFAARARGAEMALFFFAGHGAQIDGANHLLTSGFSDITAEQIGRHSIDLDAVRAALASAGPDLGLIVLDACRNNPLVAGGLAAGGLARARGGSRLLIAYATDPGSVAYDGLESNSVFTAALLDHLATPGLEVRLMFGRVRQAVVLASDGVQVPWVEESVLGEHFLDSAPAAAPDPASALADEVALWREAARTGTAEGYRRYLDRHPQGLYWEIAAERMQRLATGPGPATASAVPAGPEREGVVAALATLGFVSTARGADGNEIDAGFAAYQRQLGAGAGLDGLYLDASQMAVMVAALTAQRIRTDVAALASIETALGMAGRARAELADLAEASTEAAAALPRADADIAAMRDARATVLARLDESRGYYAELVARSSRHFRPWLPRALPATLDRTRAAAASPGRVAEDAGRFVEHATADGTPRAEGSYGWLADFLPGE